MYFQPERTRICGQVAVANVTGVPLDAVLARFKHLHGTKTAEIKNVLQSFGYQVEGLTRQRSTDLAIGKMRWRHDDGRLRGWHWVARLHDGTLCLGYEPATQAWYRCFMLGTVTSWLNIRRVR